MKTEFQTTTHIGLYSMFGGFLNIFKDIKTEDFIHTFSGLTFGEIFSMAIPFAIGLWAMLHDDQKGNIFK
jgi:hypothetical protein